MPEGNSQSITGDGNVGVSNISDSTVTVINNYGLPSAPQPLDSQNLFLSSLGDFSFQQNPLPELFRVNCDREYYLELLCTHCQKHENHLLYFILSCPNQRPESLVKHFVFDLIEENGSNDSSLKFKREKEGERSISIGTINKYTKFEYLRKEWLALFKKDDVDFASFVETELPEINLQYAIHAFEAFLIDLDEKKFKDIISSFLDAFKLEASKGPKCILFFVIKAPDYCQDTNLKPKESNILNYLKELSINDSNRVLFINSLPQVELNDLKIWLHRVFRGRVDPLNIFRKWAKDHPEYSVEIGVESNFLIDMTLIRDFQEQMWNNRSRLNDH